MCGFVGCVTRKIISIDKILTAIENRGPNGFSKRHFITNYNFNIHLSHRRQSIIDITEKCESTS